MNKKSSHYTLHGVKLPRPSYIKSRFDLKVGRRRIANNKKGAQRILKIIENYDYFGRHWDRFYELTGETYNHLWHWRLEDVDDGTYPSYILAFDHELRKIVPTMKRVLNR